MVEGRVEREGRERVVRVEKGCGGRVGGRREGGG
jgi:hypothetical protein